MSKANKEIRELSIVELEKRLRDTRKELLEARLNKQAGKLEKSHLLSSLRHDIARINTALVAKSVQA